MRRELAAAYHDLYLTVWERIATVGIGYPGHNGISHDDSIALDDAAERVELALLAYRRRTIVLNNYVVSLIRTWVPVAVGTVLGWLATLGLHVPPGDRVGVTAVAVAVITGAYYAGVRAAEAKWPWCGVLLGHPAKPSYAKPGGSHGGTDRGPGADSTGRGRPGRVADGRTGGGAPLAGA